jgi:maltose alpha-D-glucosyltransferase / alpha-amylase
MNDRQQARGSLSWDPLWYRNGIFYEVHVRAFCDHDGNGAGDFRGLVTKLDYLQDLGVTAIWLLPFYPSPLRDDGYDIADYYDVHPMYGTLGDFRQFLREAHRRGLRVITELVLNHTSDQHPWFQRARRAPRGSRWRDYYVWSDTPDRYRGTRIIFKDVETSNWAWDPVAGAYYWHRFFSHQPDLNYDHPPVHKEMMRAVDFWLNLGVDGLRLDAVPYLYEREGTSCENLLETHEFLRRVREHVDRKYGDRMLLAEANQWPEEAVAYLGGGRGDECHMAFHFPLMPRLFMAVRMEDRVPIVDILQQTPPLPETAQWAVFLRNHDELTLEMVTDEERDYMYRMYAHVPQARLNLGIRRRLAPLLGNDRKRIELLNALLFSLPGTPVIYYGDEIGMGENIYLGDRNGVRTPMQWSADRNAGFSRANPQSLYLPINFDPENHYEAVNVDVQQRNPHSLLWWMKRLIALRRRWPAFGRGALEFIEPENRRILAFVRQHESQCVLVVANLSRFVQPVELDLGRFAGRVPVELFGRTEFPPVGERPYFLTLGPHAFYWFSLELRVPAGVVLGAGEGGVSELSVLEFEESWEELLEARRRAVLEGILAAYLPGRRWFGGKTRAIKGVHIQEKIEVPGVAGGAWLVFLRVDYVHADPDLYLVPLTWVEAEGAGSLPIEKAGLVMASVKLARSGRSGWLMDALGSRDFARALLEWVMRRRGVHGQFGELVASQTSHLRGLREAGLPALEPALSRAEQSNSSIIYGDRLILKLLRRLEPGVNPELELGRFLADRGFAHVPALAGALEYEVGKGEPMTVGVLSGFVPNCKDAWVHALETLERFYDRVAALPEDHPRPVLATGRLVDLASADLPASTVEWIGTYQESARLLGERTAALHGALAGETEDPAFVPEPFTPHYVRGLYQSMRNLTRRTLQLLQKRLKALSPEVGAEAERVLGLEPEMLRRFRVLYERPMTALRIRHHGDFHLGQVLHTGKDFLLVDFEGEPARSLGERRLKRSPLRDVAGMIRSFDYAAHAALFQHLERGSLSPAGRERASMWARSWSGWVGVMYFRAYREAVRGASFLPQGDEELQVLMDAYVLEKAVYELAYELNNRPDWLRIPLQGIRLWLGDVT